MAVENSAAKVDPDSDRDLRRLILDRASGLLVEDGYAGISMRKIASAIGYSATTIYHHFGSKDGLFHALVDEGMERLARYLEDADGRARVHGLRAEMDGASYDSPEHARLGALCHAYVRFGLENREYYEIMFLVTPDAVERYPINKYRRARRNLDLFADAVAGVLGASSSISPSVRLEATTVWAALHGIVALIVAGRIDRSLSDTQFVADAIKRIVRAYAADAYA